jgi:hypothetical protein
MKPFDLILLGLGVWILIELRRQRAPGMPVIRV